MSSLRSIAASLGGRFETAEGVTPDHFGNVAEEVEAGRTGAIVVDRSDRGKLAFTGEDRASFLHGMLTNTVEGLVEGGGNHAALTDVKGTIQADLWVYHWGDRLMIEMEPDVREKVAAFLDRYIIADDVTISDASDRYTVIGVQGPDATRLVGDVTGSSIDLEEYESAAFQMAGHPVRVCRRTYTGTIGYDVWLEAGGEEVFKAVVDAGATPAGRTALEVLRIESGIPKYGVDVDDRVVPLEGGMEDTVDFTKGCFIGQEVLGKMKNIGKPRRFLVGIEVDADTVPGLDSGLTVDGKVVGLVKSGIRSERLNKTICLASVRRGYEEPGTSLSGADGWTCRVVPLPFA